MHRTTRKFIGFLWLVAACGWVAGAGRPGPGEFRFERVEVEARRLMQERRVPSYAVAVLRGDGPLYVRALGVRSLATGEAATADTLYNIGSVTKTFTALLLMQQRDAGKLLLTDRISKFLPQHVKLRGSLADATLLQLAVHTSGLPRDAPNRSKTGYDVADLYKGLARTRLDAPPGSAWSYSNFGVDLLGHLLELVAQKSYEQLLQDGIFGPLEMTSSTVALSEAEQARFAAHYWSEDDERRERPRWVWGEVAGAGGITSSLNDMVKYVSFLLSTEDRDGMPITIASRGEMFGAPPPLSEDPKMTQCLAWMASHTVDKGVWYTHGGEVDGHSAYVSFSPAQDLGLVVLSNLGGDTASALGDWLERELHRVPPTVR